MARARRRRFRDAGGPDRLGGGSIWRYPSKRVPLINGGHNYLKYLEAKAVGSEPGYDAPEPKKEAYAAAIAEGRMPFELFEKALGGTPKEKLDATVEGIDACLQAMDDSQPLFEEKFGDYAPSYGKLRESLEEIRRIVRGWAQKKGETEAASAPPPEPAAATEQPADEGWGDWGSSETTATPVQAAPAPVAKGPRRVTSVEPADKDDAGARVAAAAAFWRREDPVQSRSLPDASRHALGRAARGGRARSESSSKHRPPKYERLSSGCSTKAVTPT